MRLSFPFIWRPKRLIPSLADLSQADGVHSKTDVTIAVSGRPCPSTPLIVAELKGGKIIGDLRLVATAEDDVVGGLQSIFGSEEPKGHYLLRRRRIRFPQFRRGTALLLGSAASDNYYHWMLESLPRWKMLLAANWRDYDYVLLHSQPVRFQEEVLDRLQIPVEKRLHCSKNAVHQFERLVVPAMPFRRDNVSVWACAWLRSLFQTKATGHEKLFLKRGNASRRRLLNEPELETALQEHGFVSVQADGLSVEEQAKLMGSARCVVAPHGAALTNIVFAAPRTLVFELFHPRHKNECYVNLAAACGHQYASLDGEALTQTKDRQLEYRVDVPRVLAILNDHLE